MWYLNVHAEEPYQWIRTRAVLCPGVLILSWIAPNDGRGLVSLDLINHIEVRSVPSPHYCDARDDIGSIAAQTQTDEERAVVPSPEGEGLADFLCPFQLLYSDGLERLGAKSARERVRWVAALWYVDNGSPGWVLLSD